MEGDPRLTATAKRLLEDPAQIKLVSVVSGWEIAIKMGTGKLTLALPFKELFPGRLDSWGFKLLPIECPHLHRLLELPRHHGDPFDRLTSPWLVATRHSMRMASGAFGKIAKLRLYEPDWRKDHAISLRLDLRRNGICIGLAQLVRTRGILDQSPPHVIH